MLTISKKFGKFSLKEKRLLFDAPEPFDPGKDFQAAEGVTYDAEKKIVKKEGVGEYDVAKKTFKDAAGSEVSMMFEDAAAKFGQGFDVARLAVIEVFTKESQDVQRGAVIDRSILKYEDIKDQITEDFKSKVAVFEALVKLKGSYGDFDVPDDLNLNLLRAALAGEILKNIPDTQASDIAAKLKETFGAKLPSDKEITPEAGKEILANMMAAFLLAAASTDFNNKFKYFGDFKKSEKASGLDKRLKLKVDVDGLANTKFNYTFVGGEVVQKAFEEFKTEKLAVEAPGQQSPQYLEARKKNIGVLKNSLAGWLLVGLGIVKPGTDNKISDDAWGEILDGGNPFASIIVGFLGGGQLMADGGAGFTQFMDNIPKKYKGVVEGFQKQAKALSLQGKGANLAEIAKGGVEAQGTFKSVDGNQFREIWKDSKNLPEKGVVLKEDVTLQTTEKLKLTVKDGGEVVVPKGKKLDLIGENLSTESGKDTVIKDREKELVVSATIPKGTSFNGKVKFELVASSS